MNKKVKKTKDPSKKRPSKNQSPPIEIASRADLASFIGVDNKTLTYILYKLDRKAAYRTIEIPKSNGKVRTLNAVQGHLKWLQRRTLDKLQPAWKPSGYAHGFAPGKSIITNSALHRRKKLVVKLDMADFFPSITFPRVQGMFMAPPFRFGHEAATTMAQMACLDDEIGALPQGGVLSPYISNMLCRRLDKKLAVVAQQNKCRYSRYADDLTFSTNDINEFKKREFLKKVRKLVEEENFAINETKTRSLTRADRQIVTGIVINDGVNVNRKYVRNIRAILYNCEKHGIESQACKSEMCKDSRSSRFVSRSVLIEAVGGSSEENLTQICQEFLWHLFGRLEFVRQVVLSNGQKGQPDRYERVGLYRKLMSRFYKLIEKNPQHEALKKVVLSRIEKQPGGGSIVSLWDARSQARRKSVRAHREDFETKQRHKVVNNAETIRELQEEIEKWAVNDPRFFRLSLPTNLDKAKDKARKLVMYPAIDRYKTNSFFKSLILTDGLGALTHDTDGFTLKKAFALLEEHYEDIAYILPPGLKKLVKQYVETLEKVIPDCGEDQVIHVNKNVGIKDAAKRLKNCTRIGTDENETKIEEILNKAIRYAEQNCDTKKGVNCVMTEIKKTTVMTDVGSIQNALNRIMHSMLENTTETQIAIAANIEAPAHKCSFNRYVITISDKSSVNFDIDPTREFVGGKLTQAVRYTNGLCDYHFEANFKDERSLINMHSGLKGQSCRAETEGVIHRLGFWLSKLPTQELKDRTQGRPDARNHQQGGGQNLTKRELVQDAGSALESPVSSIETKKVLILDIRDDRRNRMADAGRQIGGLSIDSRSAISREQYEAGNYDVAFVHKGNDEWLYIEDDWVSPDTTIVLYSGEWKKSLDKSDDIIRASAKSIEVAATFRMVLKEALSR